MTEILSEQEEKIAKLELDEALMVARIENFLK